MSFQEIGLIYESVNIWRIDPLYAYRLFSENGNSDDGYLREKIKKFIQRVNF